MNLIPYNSTDVHDTYQAPSNDDTRSFQRILRAEYQLAVTVRENHGMDIDGACGQLAVKKIQKSIPSGSRDIEELVSKPSSSSTSTSKEGCLPILTKWSYLDQSVLYVAIGALTLSSCILLRQFIKQ